MRTWIVVLCVVFLPWQALAAGYGIYEWGARGNALGGAMVARDADPSAVAYNPASITDLPGNQFQIGLTAVAPTGTMDVHEAGLDSMDFEDNVWPLPTMYYTRQLSDNYWFGMGMFSRVGLGTDYDDPDTWAGRYDCSHAGIESVSFTPNLAMKFSEAFSLAVGLDMTYLNFTYDKYMDANGPYPGPADIQQQIEADGWGYGMSLAARYRPFDWLAFGVLWRSEIQLTVDGDAEFNQKGSVRPTDVGLKSKIGVSGTEPVPESVTMGVMVKPMDRLSLEFDAVWTRWSSYKELVIEYDEILGERSADKRWNNAWRFEFGAEYALTDTLDLRCGYVYDQTPVNDDYEDFAVPCSDRQIVTLGAGWTFLDDWTVDVSYGYLWMKDRDYEARSDDPNIIELTRKDAQAHMAGLSLTYRF